jgi:threonine dehydrogenase-like Zn-dependent dehydrogenase
MDFHDLCNQPSIRIVGVHNGSHPAHATAADPWTKLRDVELFCDLVLDGELDMAPLITHRRPHREAPEMYAMLLADRGQAMGVVLDWTV